MSTLSWTIEMELSPAVSATPRRMLIDGAWVDAASGLTIDVEDPSTGRIIGSIARGGATDIDGAVRAARQAFESGSWAMLRGGDRAKLMWRLAELIEQYGDELALIETLDNGKPIVAARQVDVRAAAEKFRHAAGWAGKLSGESISVDAGIHAYTIREPIGVVGLIVPWNFPLMMAAGKLAEALAAGCCVVLKPSEQTSLSVLRLGELSIEAGFPPGVINIVTGLGSEAGSAMASHPGIDKISFTGSTSVGKGLLAAAAGNLKRLTLELGGKSPSFVFADADLAGAAQSVFRNIFYNAGQVCAAGSRVYAHRSVYDRLLADIVARAGNLKIGPGIDRQTELGPVVSQRQLGTITNYIAGAVEAGATIAAGGKRRGQTGFFIEPTIITDTNADMTIRREEVFGPVLCITPFDDEDLEVLAREANNSEYGLSAYVFTQNLSIAHRMARLIKAGFVRVNGAGIDNAIPFGGYKQSGWGRENGHEGVLSYTELKSVSIAL